MQRRIEAAARAAVVVPIWKEVNLAGALPKPERVWRYVDYPKFLHILESGSLYCAKLSRMPDFFEGHLPMKAARAESEASSSVLGLGRLGKMRLGTSVDDNRARLAREAEELRTRTYVSCWHLASVETDALWRMYARDGNGVALGTTVQKLMDSTSSDHEIHVGKVLYTRFDEDGAHHPGIGNAFRKREAFQHDQELRMAVQMDAALATEDHLLLPVDLAILVERVRLAPGTPKPVTEAVSKLVARYGLDGGLVEGSILDKRPSY